MPDLEIGMALALCAKWPSKLATLLHDLCKRMHMSALRSHTKASIGLARFGWDWRPRLGWWRILGMELIAWTVPDPAQELPDSPVFYSKAWNSNLLRYNGLGL